MKSLKKRRIKIPDALILLLGIILFFGILSLIMSWLNVKTTNAKGEEVSIHGAGIMQWLSFIPLGLYNSVVISVFLFIFGSFMFITIKTRALNSIVLKFLRRGDLSKELDLINSETSFVKKTWLEVKNLFNQTWVILPVMLFLSLNGTFNGMGTSSLPIYAFVVPVFLAAGFDIWSAFLVVFVGAGCGVMGSTVNPFATIIATDIANDNIKEFSNQKENISLTDGMAWRWVIWIVLYFFSCFFVMTYAYRVKKNKHNSYFYDKFDYYKSEFNIMSKQEEDPKFSRRNVIITVVFFLSFFLMLFFVIPYDKITGNPTFENLEKNNFNDKKAISWFHNSYVDRDGGARYQFGAWNLKALSVYFFVATLLISFLHKSSPNQIVKDFTAGCQKMIPAVLCIGMASGLSVLFEKTNLKYYFINKIVETIKDTGGKKGYTIPLLTYIFTIPVSLLIPSTSGLAKAMFPVLGPAVYKLETIDGISQNYYLSGTITSYTLGIGLGNLFAPTYAAVVVSTQFCRIDYFKFLRCIWKYLLLAFIIGLLMIIFGAMINGQATSKVSIF